MIVTLRDLERLRACYEHRLVFEDTFGSNATVEVTRDTLIRAQQAGLDLNWWAATVLGAAYTIAIYDAKLAMLQDYTANWRRYREEQIDVILRLCSE